MNKRQLVRFVRSQCMCNGKRNKMKNVANETGIKKQGTTESRVSPKIGSEHKISTLCCFHRGQRNCVASLF